MIDLDKMISGNIYYELHAGEAREGFSALGAGFTIREYIAKGKEQRLQRMAMETIEENRKRAKSARRLDLEIGGSTGATPITNSRFIVDGNVYVGSYDCSGEYKFYYFPTTWNIEITHVQKGRSPFHHLGGCLNLKSIKRTA